MKLQAGLVTYEDLSVDDYFYTGNIDITETHIVNFAGISGDFFDVHMDREFALSKGFSGKIAHGLLVLSLVDGLKNRAPTQLNAIASLGWKNWEFKAPVCAGDSINCKITIAAKRKTSRGDRGIVKLDFEVYNHESVLVQSGTNNLLIAI
jgi:3-hydroxybutyryl-CoA dehydratase